MNKMRGLRFLALSLAAAAALWACDGAPKVATVGEPAPDFTLTDRQGRTWKLSELEGQVVFVNFWASWCPPCRDEMPSMQRLFTSVPEEGFKMLSILYNDTPEAGDGLVRAFGLTFPVLVDPGGKTARAYGLTGVPETFVVDKLGVLREKYIGPRIWDSPQARQMLAKYIGG
jgi:peroxiredoxin